MGRASVKKNKSVYQEAREALKLTRAQASELLGCITDTRIEKIESGAYPIHPDEVLVMAEKYKRADLCNYYCSNECPIGKIFVPKVEMKDLQTITLEMLNLLNRLDVDKNKLIEITADGQITGEEVSEFNAIKDNLDKMSLAIDSLKLWLSENQA